MKYFSLLFIFNLALSSFARDEELVVEHPERTLFVFLVDGNGSQLYHDYNSRTEEDDREVYANDNAYAKALEFARACDNCEVFTIHVNPQSLNHALIEEDRSKRRNLADGILFHHFIDGNQQEGFSVKAKQLDYDMSETLRRTADRLLVNSSAGQLVNYNYSEKHFIFVGHRPVNHQDQRSTSLEVSSSLLRAFGLRLREMLGGRFDSSILSNCKGGTPLYLKYFAAFSNYSVAAPGDISLAHMSVRALEFLNYQDDTIENRLKSFIDETYEREIEKRTTMPVAIALYNHQELAPFYRNAMANTRTESNPDGIFLEYSSSSNYLDCTDWELFATAGLTYPEVYIRYRELTPFIPLLSETPIHKTWHSGWICKEPMNV